ncbi:universal stress protein [Thalassotalea sp. G2M2-11]|uniref:universal stress protein n=1 Tax=Thalassotalea sp. G2M2-11 TaxID=2787627 RepID=UPI0019CFFA39|nr:universal stress protein [Thalassotalea sp. G2M2-11]
MNSFKNILTVVQPRTDDLLAVKKSMILAKRNFAKLTVLYVVPKSSFYDNWIHRHSHNGHTPDIQAQLEQLIASADDFGVRAEFVAVEDNDFAHAIEQQFGRDTFDLVVAEHQKQEFRLWPFDEKAYQKLIDVSPSAVMFVGQHKWHEHGHILAAIETEETSICHKQLNHEIVAKTDEMAKLLQSDSHFVNCYLRSCHIAFDIEHHILNEYEQHFNHLSALVESYHCDKEKLHIEEGIVDDVIPQQANALDANIVVLGCNEHKGIAASVKGHTIDFILDKLPCDVLALQPNVH